MNVTSASGRGRNDADVTVAPRPENATRWAFVAVFEVALAAAAVLMDLAIPSLVVLVLMAVSLLIRRQNLASLGLHRVARAWVMAIWMFAAAVAWTMLDAGLLKPVETHLTGLRQDMSAFTSLQGNAGLLLVWLTLAWVLAALGETLAFIGYVRTRIREATDRFGAAPLLGSVLASVLLGLLHTEYGFVGVSVSTVNGLFYCLLRDRCGTLWAPILAHGFIDTFGLVTVFLVGPVYGLW
jgi:membrane protease YdiL (CAAX protease family)